MVRLLPAVPHSIFNNIHNLPIFQSTNGDSPTFGATERARGVFDGHVADDGDGAAGRRIVRRLAVGANHRQLLAENRDFGQLSGELQA